jgi:hypothetical protein
MIEAERRRMKPRSGREKTSFDVFPAVVRPTNGSREALQAARAAVIDCSRHPMYRGVSNYSVVAAFAPRYPARTASVLRPTWGDRNAEQRLESRRPRIAIHESR